MSKSMAIIYGVFGVLVVLAVVVYHVPGFWIFLAVIVFLLAKTFNPFRLSVETIPQGFTEKKFDTGEVILNYVEGPDNGPPLLFIPGQMEFWQGYKLVMPHFSKNCHVFAIDLRGHGKSTKTPGRYSYNICGEDLKIFLEKSLKSLQLFRVFLRVQFFLFGWPPTLPKMCLQQLAKILLFFLRFIQESRKKDICTIFLKLQ